MAVKHKGEQLEAMMKLAKFLQANGYEYDMDNVMSGMVYITVRIPEDIELPGEEELAAEED